jgi:hypothetical protein
MLATAIEDLQQPRPLAQPEKSAGERKSEMEVLQVLPVVEVDVLLRCVARG